MSQPHLILVAEFGRIEHQAHQFVRTFRANGGCLKDVPIWVYHHVRAGQRPLNPEVVKALQDLDVSLRKPKKPNQHFARDPFANKIYALADAEEHLSDGILTWIDSDIACFHEPIGLMMPRHARIAARPENSRTIATPYPGKLNWYWREIYELAGLKPAQYDWPITSLKGNRTYPFFNSGVMQARLGYNIFTRAREIFETLFPVFQEMMPRHILQYLLEQAINSACLLRAIETPSQFHQLPLSYNMPLWYLKQRGLYGPLHLLHYHRARFDVAHPNALLSENPF